MRAIFYDGVPVLFPGPRAEGVMTDAIRLFPGLDRQRYWIGDYDGTLPFVGEALVKSMAKLEESGLQRVIAHSKVAHVNFPMWCDSCRYAFVSDHPGEVCPACKRPAAVARAKFRLWCVNCQKNWFPEKHPEDCQDCGGLGISLRCEGCGEVGRVTQQLVEPAEEFERIDVRRD